MTIQDVINLVTMIFDTIKKYLELIFSFGTKEPDTED